MINLHDSATQPAAEYRAKSKNENWRENDMQLPNLTLPKMLSNCAMPVVCISNRFSIRIDI